MGGPTGVSCNNTYKELIPEAIFGLKLLKVVASRNSGNDPKFTSSNITLFEREARRLIHPHVDTLVVTL